MFRLLRYFSITSLIAFIIVIAALGYLSNRAAVDALIELEESKSYALTRVFANTLWPEFRPHITMSAGLTAEALRAHPETERLRQAIIEQTEGLSIVKVKVYNLDGLTVFSSEAVQIGEDKRDNPGFQTALAGGVASELTHRDTFSAFDGTLEDRDVLSSYIPVYGENGAIEGVLEVYSDITELIVQLEQTQRTILLAVTLLLAILYAVLLYIVRWADRVIHQQAADLQQAKVAAEEANRAKSEFTSVVAHEIKTPLTVIRGYADLLSKVLGSNAPDGNHNLLRYLGIIQANVGRMVTLASDLSDISRIEAGQLQIELEPLSLPAVIEDVSRSIQGQLENKEQRLAIQVADALPAVWADRNRLAQVLTNLVSNAHKYTPSGGQITISAAPHNGVVQVAIQDTGIGIRPEDQPKIFQRFFRSEDEKTREEPGTGLGLNITRSLVEKQGGRIWFESAFRQGTTFYFTVPTSGRTVKGEQLSVNSEQ
jgi:signal transduction histidine kinase